MGRGGNHKKTFDSDSSDDAPLVAIDSEEERIPKKVMGRGKQPEK
jgi:hypothetical protein